jgi:hypothetical protein
MSTEQSGPFGGMTPQEAGKKSAEKRRLEREPAQSDPQELIIAKATEKALAGDVQAMKLLLDLKVLVPQTPESKDERSLLELRTLDQRLRNSRRASSTRLTPTASTARAGTNRCSRTRASPCSGARSCSRRSRRSGSRRSGRA